MCHTIRQSRAPKGSPWACHTGLMSTVCPWSEEKLLLHNGKHDVCTFLGRKPSLLEKKKKRVGFMFMPKKRGVKSPGEATVTRCPNRSSVSVLAAACSYGRVSL